MDGDGQMQSLRDAAIAELVDGRYGHSANKYQKFIQIHGDDLEARLELACALAGKADLSSARKILDSVGEVDLTPAQRARYLTAMSWIRTHENHNTDVREPLQRSITEDPRFIPPYISLARIALWKGRDPEKAAEILALASNHTDSSQALSLHLAAIELRKRQFASAALVARSLRTQFPSSLRALAAAILTSLMASPRQGFVVVSLFGLLSLVPFLGSFFYLLGSLVLLGSIFLLRRLGPDFVVTPLLYAVELTGIFLGRLIIYGTFFP